ncbi:GlgB N-terminal domain-containing protein [Streptomyces typhae]|uniref:alpha-glucosidase C-terminal domain-containing protein n=1 Tax=Streptomyces typhae TaxID=2681492 RepID=UPI003CCCD826
MSPEDRSRLLAGTHHDPHGVLGAHRVAGGVAFRALRPYARAVTVLAGELRAELTDDGDGFFSTVVPLRDVPADYRLHLAYDEATLEIPDAYAFLPALGEFDLHLIGEGRHERLWDALGAQPMTHQGTRGTRFTVWAPNARGVRVVGNFNYWDGVGFPMRSLGGSGVWELFVPGLGAGELYKFQITRPDGSMTFRADPLARRTEAPPANSSVVDESRLLHWTRRMIEIRKQNPAFGLGSYTELPSSNPAVLAFLREYGDDLVMCVHNFSRFAQPTELDLRVFDGRHPVELIGGVRFPAIGELPYLLTLAGHGFYWFRLRDDLHLPLPVESAIRL